MTLTINSLSSDQETAIRLFLDALHIEYKTSNDTDDTDYLMSTPENADHLRKSFEQAKNGEITVLGLDDIWKA